MKGNIVKIMVCLLLLMPGLGHRSAEATDMETAIYSMVYSGNPNPGEALWITQAILYAAQTYDVDPLLVTAVMDAESNYHHNCISRVGAIGLMQLMPNTAVVVGVDPYDPLDNIIGGTIYLRNQLDNFRSWGEYGVTYAVAAYNAGPQAVRDYQGIPPYRETVNYVNNVADAYQRILRILES